MIRLSNDYVSWVEMIEREGDDGFIYPDDHILFKWFNQELLPRNSFTVHIYRIEQSHRASY